ncbi:MAG: hypothetical protein RLZZ396_2154, partial [Planctomycetota bacterium]
MLRPLETLPGLAFWRKLIVNGLKREASPSEDSMVLAQ